MGLEGDVYRHVHEFAFVSAPTKLHELPNNHCHQGNWDMDTKLSLLYIAMAGLETKLDKLLKIQDRVRKNTDRILVLVDEGWVMKPPLKVRIAFTSSAALAHAR